MKWSPQGQFPEPNDTWNAHSQAIDFGVPIFDPVPALWTGTPDASRRIGITYTITDLTNGVTTSAAYDLGLHDQFENWRRVNSQGTPVAQNSAGESGAVVQLGTTSNAVPAGPAAVSYSPQNVAWNIAGIAGGGVLAGTGAVVSVLGKTPTWVGFLLSLAGLAAQTVASLPTDTSTVNSPDQMNANFMQTAYNNYVYNQTALPGQQITNDLVDTNFYQLLKNKPDFSGFYSGIYGQVSVTTTLSQQMLNYYFNGNEYDNAGLLRTNAPGSVAKPGGLLWAYLWTCAGSPKKPNAFSPMPSP